MFASIWLLLVGADGVRFVAEPQDNTLRLRGDGDQKLTLSCAVETGERGRDVEITWKKDGVKLDQSL